jgi:hypothetical protein
MASTKKRVEIIGSHRGWIDDVGDKDLVHSCRCDIRASLQELQIDARRISSDGAVRFGRDWGLVNDALVLLGID